jgi:hypothetical protein
MVRMVIVENRDGAQYAVAPADFERGAADQWQGFRIVSYEDGEKYEGPKTAAAIAKAHDAEAAPAKGEAAPAKAEGKAAKAGE